jgi:hypothetical protein
MHGTDKTQHEIKPGLDGDSIEVDCKLTGYKIMDWIYLIQGMAQWLIVVSQEISIHIP